LRPEENDGIDLTHSLDIVTTLDVAQSEYEEEFTLTFEGDNQTFALGPMLFGGCPAYLAKWIELNRIAEEEDPDPEIQREEMIALAQTIVDRLVKSEGGKEIVVRECSGSQRRN